jgi:hypothetical protein
LLVVNTPELRILRIDGYNVQPTCIGRDGVREYHLPAGTHTITASFRYAAPVSGGLLGEVHGRPLTVQCQLLAGHEYVPVYREHAHVQSPSRYLAEALGKTLAGRDRYWSLEIVDLAPTEPFSPPEVAEARDYCASIRGLTTTASLNHGQPLY